MQEFQAPKQILSDNIVSRRTTWDIFLDASIGEQ
jgi:hypothetical protein